MENEKGQKLQIYSYAKIWSLEHSIYSLGNINLPVPVHPYNLLYFAGALAFVMLLCKIFPLLCLLPVILRYLALPYGITIFLRKKKLDGKSPVKYLLAYIKYEFFERGRYFERFNGFSDRTEVYPMEWICSTKYHKR